MESKNNTLTIKRVFIRENNLTEHTQVFSFKDEFDLRQQFKEQEVHCKYSSFVFNQFSFYKKGKRMVSRIEQKGKLAEAQLYILEIKTVNKYI